MPTNNWELLNSAKVPAKPDAGIWTLLAEDLPDFQRLKITATGQWEYTDKFPSACTADGDTTSAMDQAHCIYSQAPIGALIGKFGGSNMGVSDGVVFLIGSLCIYERPADCKIPYPCLFVTINDRLDGFSDNSGELSVSLEKSR